MRGVRVDGSHLQIRKESMPWYGERGRDAASLLPVKHVMRSAANVSDLIEALSRTTDNVRGYGSVFHSERAHDLR